MLFSVLKANVIAHIERYGALVILGWMHETIAGEHRRDVSTNNDQASTPGCVIIYPVARTVKALSEHDRMAWDAGAVHSVSILALFPRLINCLLLSPTVGEFVHRFDVALKSATHRA